MGNKIITEKDFWVCSLGTTPAQLQSTQLSVKKESEHKYITVADTATSSWIDFGCKKLMLIMAILAAVLVVVIVATGGAALGALIAAGAIAGAAGAAFGAVVGALICGQKAAAARKWLSSKSDMIIQGQHAITGDRQMKCMLFNETITFAPKIKNWWQAVSLGGANYLGEILKGMMYGAAIGATGGVISGGPAVLGQFGVSNVAANWLATWNGWGLGLRGLVTAQSVLEAYGKEGRVSPGDVLYGVLGMEIGTLHSLKKIVTGNGTMTDVIGAGLWFIPAHARNQESKTRSEESRARSEEGRSEEAKNEEARPEENPQARVGESETPRRQGEFEAFEEGGDLGNNRALRNSDVGEYFYEGPARELHRDRLSEIIEDLESNGVRVEVREDGHPWTGSYAPGGRGKPGSMGVHRDVDIRTLEHEYQHFLDDRARGFPGLRHYLENPAEMFEMERSAYNREMDLVRADPRLTAEQKAEIISELEAALERERVRYMEPER